MLLRPWVSSFACFAVVMLPSARARADVAQDFDAAGSRYQLASYGTGPAAAVVPGGAAGNCLRLATAQSASTNVAAFSRSDSIADAITISFKFRVTPSSGRGRGLGLVLLDTANAGPNDPTGMVGPDANFAGALGIGLHTDAQADGQTSHVSLHWDGQLVTTVVPRRSDGSVLELASGSFITATLTVRSGQAAPDVSLDLSTDGTTLTNVFADLPVPGLHDYEARLQFGADSGSDGANVDLDDVGAQFVVRPPAAIGQISPLIQLGSVAINTMLLPTNRVMFWDRHDDPSGSHGAFSPSVWDPATGKLGFLSIAAFNVFCSSMTFLADGRLFVAGGHVTDYVGLPDAAIYDPYGDAWTHLPPMNAGRWYPTSTTLPNGDVLVSAGTIDTMTNNLIPQVFQVETGTWRTLSSASLGLPTYPWMFTAPNGKVFYAGPWLPTQYLDVGGTGAWTWVANTHADRLEGTSVMYDAGKVLNAGGLNRVAEAIDLNAAAPAWKSAGTFNYARRYATSTILADGKILLSGGCSSDGYDQTLNADHATYPIEMWDPETQIWSLMASVAVPRDYHSTAILLPDATVLIAGGGHPGYMDNVDSFPNAQIYSPPYLFAGPRPTISDAPERVVYGQLFNVATPDAADVAKVHLIRLSAVTHTFNMDQRILRADFQATAGGLTVTTPSNPNLCPPGYYLLFLINHAGVPSVARFLRVTQAPFAVDDQYSCDENGLLAAANRPDPDHCGGGTGCTGGGGGGIPLAPVVLANDHSSARLTLTARLVNKPSHGQISFYPDGSFSYEPELFFHGTDSFSYVANDGTVDSTQATAVITVKPVNQPPVAVETAFSVAEGGEVSGQLGAFDPDGDPLRFRIATRPEHGTLTLMDETTGAFVYRADSGATSGQSEQFTFVADDQLLESKPGIVTINVGAAAEPPPPASGGCSFAPPPAVSAAPIFIIAALLAARLARRRRIIGGW